MFTGLVQGRSGNVPAPLEGQVGAERDEGPDAAPPPFWCGTNMIPRWRGDGNGSVSAHTCGKVRRSSVRL